MLLVCHNRGGELVVSSFCTHSRRNNSLSPLVRIHQGFGVRSVFGHSSPLTLSQSPGHAVLSNQKELWSYVHIKQESIHPSGPCQMVNLCSSASLPWGTDRPKAQTGCRLRSTSITYLVGCVRLRTKGDSGHPFSLLPF